MERVLASFCLEFGILDLYFVCNLEFIIWNFTLWILFTECSSSLFVFFEANQPIYFIKC
jgi:hypothetical protein